MAMSMAKNKQKLTASFNFRLFGEKLSRGYINRRGKRIEANPCHDYAAFIEYMKKKGMRTRTIKRELLYLHKFQAGMAKETLSNFAGHIAVSQEKKNTTEESIKRRNYFVYVALKNYLKAIGKPDLAKHLPDTKEISKPSSSTKDRSITPQQFHEILGAVDNEDFRLFMKVLWDSGMRATEALLLRASWIDFRKSPVEITIPLEISKSREEGTAYLTNGTANDLRSFIEKKFGTSDYAKCNSIIFNFIGSESEKKSLEGLVSEFWYVHKTLNFHCKQAGINKHISAHSLRHSFAHRLGRKGFMPAEIQRLMRHSSLLTTDRYLKTSQKQVGSKYDKAFNK
jgi:integrase